MDTRKRKRLLKSVIIVLTVTTVIYNMFRICTCLYFDVSEYAHRRMYYYGTLEWFSYFSLFKDSERMIFFANSLICLLVSIITVLGVIKGNKKCSLFTLGIFYALESTLNIFTLINLIHMMSISFSSTYDYCFVSSLECVLLLCTSILTAVSLCLFAVDKVNYRVAFIFSLLNSIFSTVFIAKDLIKYSAIGDPYYRFILPILSLSIYILTICIVCMYSSPTKQKHIE